MRCRCVPENEVLVMLGARQPPADGHTPAKRLFALTLGVVAAFSAIGLQLVRLSASGERIEHATLTEPVARSWSRPDIVDRAGRLLATDVATSSLYADPRFVQDRDETVEKLRTIFPDLDEKDLLRQIAEDGRRFLWIRRGLTPKLAQSVHNLGLPGLGFRREPHRVYPLGPVAAHVLGQVGIDNQGLSGLERHIDDRAGAELVLGAAGNRAAPLRLSIDLSVQHALRAELADAMSRYAGKAAAGLVLDVATGEILAAASLPDFDPNRPAEAPANARLDRLQGGVFELGSVWKIFTLAMVHDLGLTGDSKTYDVREPLVLSGRTINDFHGQKRPLTGPEVFIHSSNIGASMMALDAGRDRQREFLGRIGVLQAAANEAGAIAPPLLPQRRDDLAAATISYGHGIAVAPLQFAGAVAALVNGGYRVQPTFLSALDRPASGRERLVRAQTSARIRALLALNVTSPLGSGSRAEVPGLAVGGKTGTAEMPKAGGYAEKSVIASFVAAFPIDDPKFLTLVMLFEPGPVLETKGQLTAGFNAAPTTARLIARIAPLLGIYPRIGAALPRKVGALPDAASDAQFDATREAKY